jgi:hypothetical protein
MVQRTQVQYWETTPTLTVYPSGAARAARPMPMLPPVPATFSMTIGWPRLTLIGSAMLRAIESRTGRANVRDLKSIAASGELSGELRLGVMQTSLSGLFAGILIPFTRTYPRIDVRIVRDTSAGLYPKLLNGEIVHHQRTAVRNPEEV